LRNWSTVINPFDQESRSGVKILIREVYPKNIVKKFSLCVRKLLHVLETRQTIFLKILSILAERTSRSWPSRKQWSGPLCSTNFVAWTSCSYNPKLNTSSRTCESTLSPTLLLWLAVSFYSKFLRSSFVSCYRISCYCNDVNNYWKFFAIDSDIQWNIEIALDASL